MVGINLDLFGALEKWIEFRKANEWFKLCLSLLCSFWFSSTFVWGGALVVHRPFWEAFGSGLVAGATRAVICWRYSPLTRGMVLALPVEEAKVEMESGNQVIRG